MKKRVTGILITAALLLIAVSGITGAGAYFTARDTGSQSHKIQLGDSATVDETTDGWNKKVTITNSAGSSQAVWVRARAYAGKKIEDLMEVGGEEWAGTKGDWYYCQNPVEPGNSAPTLLVQVPDHTVNPLVPEEGTEFNVIVVYETTPALDIDGSETCETANWDAALSSQTGGESG